tara:strand:+ start:198 stop:1160 length:963 start_codon:yes stop_codon:yes gene_type:complete
MNIALIYDYEELPKDGSLEFFEEQSLNCGTSLRESFRELGCNVRTFCLNKGKSGNGLADCKKAMALGYKPDVIYLQNAGELTPPVMETWNKSNFPHVLMVAEVCDEWQIYRYNLPWARKADLVLTPDHQCVLEYAREGALAFWVPHWVDERVFAYNGEIKSRGCTTTSKPSAWKDQRGFSFFNEKLQEIFGKNFSNPCYDKGGDYISIQDNGKLYKESKIVWQFSSSGDWTRRIWEGAAAKALVITDKLHPVRCAHQLAIEDEEIIYYTSLGDCIEKITYYLEHSLEREKIAQRLYERTMRDHTGIARAKQIKEILAYAV